ncbi:MAG: TonB-dependent receptor [Bacteroidota bacterium]
MRSVLLVSFLLSLSALSAQSIVKGKVLTPDGESAMFATVIISNPETEEVITAANTDLDGNFELQTSSTQFDVAITYVGFAEKRIDDISVIDNFLDMGSIELQEDVALLDEVLVVGERSTTEIQLDKRVFNVGKDLNARGGSALNVLENVPSVQVDVEGNVSLRGSGGVRILINGRPNGLVGDGGQGLRALTADMIEQIEVITNPSARYEAEGAAGVINIILKKDRRKGFNGSFDVNAGLPESYGGAANLNYRSGKLNWFTNYGLNYRTRIGRSSVEQDLFTDNGIFRTEQIGDRDRTGLNHNFRAGVDYNFDEKTTLTLAGRYNIGDDNNINTTTYLDFLDGDFLGRTIRTDRETEAEEETEMSLSFRKEYTSKKHVLTADIRYQDEVETESSDLRNNIFSDLESGEGILDLVQRSANREANTNLIFQTDYTLPFGENGKFEAGARIGIRTITNDFTVEELENDIYETLPEFTNEFFYDENIYAAYLMYGNKKGNLSYQVGLRPEYTGIKTELVTTAEVNDRDFLNFFPSANLGYEFSETKTLQFSYSRRISRPSFWSLNPFFTFSDDRNFWSGNPDLNPEFSHNVELGFLRILEKGSVFASAYYRRTTGVTERIQRVNPDGTTITRPENLATQDNLGFELTANYKLASWLKLNGDLNLFQEIIDGGEEFPELQAETFTWFTRATARFDLKERTEGQIRFNYQAPRQTTQGRTRSLWRMDLALSHEVLKGNGSLTLSVRDVFNTRIRRRIVRGENFIRENQFQWQGTVANLALNYRINQQKPRGRRR